MNSISLEDQYADDILKVKEIWKDIQHTSNQNNKNVNHTIKKNAIKNKIKKTLFSQKTISNLKKNTNVQTIQIITNPSPKRCVLSNQKATEVKQNVFLDGHKSQQMNSQKTSQIHHLKKLIGQKDHQLSLLRINNQRSSQKIRQLQIKLEQKEQHIEKLKHIENQLMKTTTSLQSKQFNFDYGKIQYQNFKNDSRRLLKMLQNTEEYQTFAKLALNDEGVRFLHNTNQHIKTKLDSTDKIGHKLHFCNCNKSFIPQSGFWVPDKVYSFGKQFIKDRKGDFTQSQFELLLYELNRIWRERQKRIVNSLNGSKAKEIERYQRRLKQLKRADLVVDQ